MKVKGELSLYHKNAKVQYFYYIEEKRQWTLICGGKAQPGMKVWWR